MTTSKDTATALVKALRMTQSGAFDRLRAEKSKARAEGRSDDARALGARARELSHQNFVLYRAKGAIGGVQDLAAVNTKLLAIVSDAQRAVARMEGVAATLREAATLISTIRRLVDVFK